MNCLVQVFCNTRALSDLLFRVQITSVWLKRTPTSPWRREVTEIRVYKHQLHEHFDHCFILVAHTHLVSNFIRENHVPDHCTDGTFSMKQKPRHTFSNECFPASLFINCSFPNCYLLLVFFFWRLPCEISFPLNQKLCCFFLVLHKCGLTSHTCIHHRILNVHLLSDESPSLAATLLLLQAPLEL